MQNFMELNMKNVFHPKTVTLGVYGLETDFGQFVTKHLITRQGQNPNLNYIYIYIYIIYIYTYIYIYIYIYTF